MCWNGARAEGDGKPEEEITQVLCEGTGKQRADDPGAGSRGYMGSCQTGKDMRRGSIPSRRN